MLWILLIWEAVTWQFFHNGTGPVVVLKQEGYHQNNHHDDAFPSPRMIKNNNNSHGENNDNDNDDDDDWFDKERWESHPGTRSCYVAENVCHSTQRFFYDDGTVLDATTSYHHRQYPQEDVILELNKAFISSGAYPQHAIAIEKKTNTVNKTDDIILKRCSYSPIHNHMILHASLNDTIFEYYVRINYGLHRIMKEATDDHQKFKRQTQLYLKMYVGPSQTMYNGHYMFSEFATSNPLLNFRSLLDYNGCRCMRRLLFCGFQQEVVKATPKTTVSAANENIYNTANQNNKTRQIRLRPYGHVGEEISLWKPPKGFFHQLKETTLVDNLIRQNPFIDSDIQEFRKTTIHPAAKYHRENLVVGEGEVFRGYHANDQDEWKIIGLVQRSKRRSWTNINEVTSNCNAKFQGQKVKCISLNIELPEWSTPTKHLVVHAGVDALIGIHGSTLTNGVLLPPGGLVVELLPWVLPEMYGWGWMRAFESPSVMGIIFSDTDINHIGYPLGRESVSDPSCAKNNDEPCYLKFAKTAWQGRDFVVPSERVFDIIEKFIISKNSMNGNNPKTTCVDYQQAAGDDYILYNINCRNETGHMEIQHHYRDKLWMEHREPKMFRGLGEGEIQPLVESIIAGK